MINTTMTKEAVDFVVNSHEGDLFGFQAYFESPVVGLVLRRPLLIFRFGWLTFSRVGTPRRCSLHRWRVSAL